MKKVTVFILVAALLLLTGCGARGERNSAEKTVAASFYPVYIFTLNLLDGIDGVKVECMAEQTVGCLHDYNLLAGDVRLLSDADAFVINGAGMEMFITDVYRNVEGLHIIDSSTGIELLCGGCEHEEHDEHEEHEGHNHENNAHIWLSVRNAVKQVENIKNGLIEVFPEYEKQITENYEHYSARLNALYDELKAASASLNGISVISFHEAYVYMADELGLAILDSIESDEGGEPSAKELAGLCDEIKEHNVKALFTEPQYNGSAAEILAAETGAKIFVLNPVVSGENELTAYEDIMRENIETIKKAVN